LTRTQRNPIDRIWDFFCSLKLTIITLLLLAVTSIIGTVLQQNAKPEEYIREYGQSNYELFTALQFTDMYHSVWFVGILGLFSVNLICCSIKNFPRAWKFITTPALIAGEGTLNNSANRAEFSSKEGVQQLGQRLAAALEKAFAKPTLSEENGTLHLFAQKGIYSRFGAYITHLSILIIMLGAIMGTVWGYKAYVNIAEGTSTAQIWPNGASQPLDLGFEVRCDDFRVTYYEGSQRPRDYKSDLVVIDNGQEVIKKTIEVNDPLTYKGLTFYQSSYGPAGNAGFKMRVTVRESGEVLNIRATQGQRIPLPGGYAFAVSDYTPSYDRFGPAAQMYVNAPDGTPGSPFIVLQQFPQFDEKREGAFSFALMGYEEPAMYTGLSVAKDPGVWVVWLGCFLMVFGSCGAFFFSHRRVWICLDEANGKTRVRLAASAHRNQPAFATAFDEMKKTLAQTIENKS
jgi:cytochrome c biogenesis protein